MKNTCTRLRHFANLAISYAICALAVACAIGVIVTPLSAQTVDTVILGTITDPSGAAIPGAQVTVTSPSTGVSHTVTTGANGAYRVGYLLPGTYTVSAQAQGFSRAVRSNITLELSQQAEVDIPLAIGQTTQSVEVTAAAPLLNTTSGALSGVVNPQETVGLPLNGRNFGQLAVLTPGVQASASSQ
ncbi:MAG TPA: carboxypeptidase-like regulatory domain-containing protein, partial [Bryobacteraceae bacterium]|nr:carboxypeptidase-like regulatory domain-containing protein [Bryobacteraceae bacterium]